MKSLHKSIGIVLLLLVLSFSLVSCDSTYDIPKTSSPESIPLFEKVLSTDEALQLSIENDVVISSGSVCVYGKEVWDEFFSTVSNGKPASILCAYYNEDSLASLDPSDSSEQSSKLTFYSIKYDGDKYDIKTRVSTEKRTDYSATFKHLNHYGLPTSQSPMTPDESQDVIGETIVNEVYILTDNPNNKNEYYSNTFRLISENKKEHFIVLQNHQTTNYRLPDDIDITSLSDFYSVLNSMNQNGSRIEGQQ